jgi:hypothetical protein
MFLYVYIEETIYPGEQKIPDYLVTHSLYKKKRKFTERFQGHAPKWKWKMCLSSHWHM